MQNLYSKIYEAINAGIQKAMVLPDEMADDISVHFHKKPISNDINMMDYYVNELRNTENDDIYIQILDYYDSYHKRYKAKSFDDLISLYYRIRLAANMLRYPVNIDWINTESAMTYVMDDGHEISVSDVCDHFDISFIRIINPIGDGNDIYVRRIFSSTEKMPYLALQYNESCENIQIYNMDDGYHNCVETLKKSKMPERYAAINYAMSKVADINCVKYQGYIPSCQQLSIFMTNYDFFDYFLQRIHGVNIDDNVYWTSEQYSWIKQYVFKNKDIDMHNKFEEGYCLILYKKIIC